MLRRLAAGLALALLAPAGVGAAELRLDWAGGGTDKDPGAWTIRLTGVGPDTEGTYAVDDGSPSPYGAGETRVPVPPALGPHHIALRGPGALALDDTRTIVDDDPEPPQLTIEYAGRILDPRSPNASGTYQVNNGPAHPLTAGTNVVAVPYAPGTYTITVTATNNDRDGPDDEDVVTRTDTREVK
ncbi:MAG: hypothetical protein DME17_10455 [Candidatus Rokuibacteriota bacterium]|nr:MAG: hypothetical protein DME17_10455 [Candidatus Rokubacteria bacterium]